MGGLLSLFFFSFLVLSSAEVSSKIGINYGQLGNNLPSAYRSIKLIRSLKAGRVKLYDANPEILKLLAGTNLHVSIMVPNNEISRISRNQTLANEWVQNNVLPYYPETMIRFLLVGNEVLSDNLEEDREMWNDLVPAMRKILNSLKANDIKNIKVGTPLAMDVLESTFPPSSGRFRASLYTVMRPLLHFLNGTKSFFFLDAYPYFPWSANPTNINLDFALFRGDISYTDPQSGLNYTNLLDQMLDSVIFAMTKLGYPNIQLLISETGWPNAGDIDQPGANIYNAAIYNRNLVQKITAKPPIGTPARPGVIVPTFIFSLYDENQKIGPGTERHWGLLHPNGTQIYEMDLSGKRSISDYKLPLPHANNNRPYTGKVWCVAARGIDLIELGTALSYACGQGTGTCDALVPGKECYEPVSMIWQASYAFSSYWAQFRSQGATCYFNGLAEQTTRDPSHGSCKVPSVSL